MQRDDLFFGGWPDMNDIGFPVFLFELASFICVLQSRTKYLEEWECGECINDNIPSCE